MTVRINKQSINLREKLSELDKPSGLTGEELLRSGTSSEARDALDLEEHLFEEFESTGIDDNATSTKVTVSDSGIDVDGAVTADGLTVETGSGNTYPSASTAANELVITNKSASTPAGITIFSDNASQGNIFFGDEQDADSGRIVYDHNGNANTMSFFASATERMRINSSGVDVTGTVTADGIQSTDGDIKVTTSGSFVGFNSQRAGVPSSGGYNLGRLNFDAYSTGTTFVSGASIQSYSDGAAWTSSSTPAYLSFQTTPSGSTSLKQRIKIANNGDVHFFEDTGTTAKMVWDASAESLGIGTSSPEAKINVVSTNEDHIRFGYSDSSYATIKRRNSDGRIGIGTQNNDHLVINTSGNVGIGTSSPSLPLDVHGGAIGVTSSTAFAGLQITARNNSFSYVNFGDQDDGNIGQIQYDHTSDSMRIKTNNTERMRLDSSGNLLVGTTNTSPATADVTGVALKAGVSQMSNNDDLALRLNRSTAGGMLEFRKDGAPVGSIGFDTSGLYIDGEVNHSGIGFAGNTWLPRDNGGNVDNIIDLGVSSLRFDDIYAANGTIQTSDRNEKQDIETLTDAEQRAAKSCKGLLRKFRWKSAVEEKGDDARIHFGIIAQDLRDAFTAEDLDAGDYAMFISSTWTDEETGEERTRLGVRYPELLAFIISAI